jgi:hypothetical protein
MSALTRRILLPCILLLLFHRLQWHLGLDRDVIHPDFSLHSTSTLPIPLVNINFLILLSNLLWLLAGRAPIALHYH